MHPVPAPGEQVDVDAESSRLIGDVVWSAGNFPNSAALRNGTGLELSA